MERKAKVSRRTKETDIYLKINLDGSGIANIKTGIPFLDHMLNLFTSHGFINMDLDATGDLEIDDHHTVEDIGICIGKGIKGSLEDMKGIRRYGEAIIPMDEALARVVMDISNRPLLAYRVDIKKQMSGNFDIGLLKEFFRALVINAGLTMHIDLLAGEEPHHVAEVIFKAFARALNQATSQEPRLEGAIPSTKGVL